MRTKHKHEKQMNAMTVIGVGVIVSVIIMIALVVMVSLLVSQEAIEEKTSNYFVPLIHIVAVCIGCYISSHSTEEKKTAVLFGTASTYYISLVAFTVLLFESTFEGVLTGLVSVLGGTLVILILGLRGRGHKTRNRLRIHNR